MQPWFIKGKWESLFLYLNSSVMDSTTDRIVKKVQSRLNISWLHVLHAHYAASGKASLISTGLLYGFQQSKKQDGTIRRN